MGQSCREPLRLCSSLCLHGVCSPGKQTVPSQAALRACQKCRPHSFDRVCEPSRSASLEEKLAPKFSTAVFSRTAPPVWLRSTVPHPGLPTRTRIPKNNHFFRGRPRGCATTNPDANGSRRSGAGKKIQLAAGTTNVASHYFRPIHVVAHKGAV